MARRGDDSRHACKEDAGGAARLSAQERELQGQARELARSKEELERFAYLASHELREPLRMVAGFTQLLARRYRGKLDAEADEFIAYAVDGAERMQALLDDLLSYSRVGNSHAAAPIPAGSALAKVLGDLASEIEQSGAAISHDHLPVVWADDASLQELFRQLLQNALKFRTQAPPIVHVAAERHDGAWLFSVRDNGIGIPQDQGERIFGVFQRLHAREDYPGTGVGLAICRKIVERHGGRIWVESAPRQGAVFKFTLPLVVAAQ